jgi:hypothetical protein
VVVSSDKEIADFASVHGAVSMGSVEFEDKMEVAAHVDTAAAYLGQEEEAGWTPTTKKKGPSRRPPKQKRKSRSRTRKL